MKLLKSGSLLKKEFTALFLLSVAVIAFELGVMRIFAVGNWSSFGEMVISIALLGNGVAGVLITFLQRRIKANKDRWLKVTAMTITPAIAAAVLLAQRIPFNPVWIVSQPVQWLWIALYYLVYAVPFFCAAMFMGVIFTVMGERARSLYFWNMAGSGIGGFVLLGLMYLLPVRFLVLPIIVLAAAGTFLLFGKKDRIPAAVMAVLLVLSFLGVLFRGDIRVSEYKGTAQARVTFADLEKKVYEFSPLGEMEVFQSAQYHFAPGLSDNAVFYLSEMPEKAFWALYVNGDGPIGIMRDLNDDEKLYMDFLPMSAPYEIKENPKVLLIGLGGCFGTFTALHHEAERITVVESNPELVKLMRDDPVVSEFNGHVLSDPRIKVVVNEPRAYARKKSVRNGYDIVEISLTDSIGLSNSVGNALHENYTYTVEAIEDYWKALNDDGLLILTSWNTIDPPRNIPRLIATGVEALDRMNIENPEQHIYSFDLLYSTATIILKKSPFTPEEIDALNYFCYRMSFEPIYYPGIPDRSEVDFEKQLEAYILKYAVPATMAGPGFDQELYSRKPGDLYYYTFRRMLEGKGKELFESYIFDIKPATDDRPYFTSFLKGKTLLLFADELSAISEEWGYILLQVTLLQALFFGLIIIFLPVIFGRKKVLKKEKGLFGIVVYYSCLGLGYMFIEIYLIQKLVYFLGDPVFSTSIVITSMLILSGLGSLYSNRFGDKTVRYIRIAAGVVALTMLLYILVLPSLLNLFLGWPLPVKMLIAIAIIFPSAFFMGMFFPTGLATLSREKEQLLPWAWGVNGALSVSGSILPKILSLHFGFSFVLLIAAGLYLTAGLFFTANSRKTPDTAG